MAAYLVYHLDSKNKAPETHCSHLYTTSYIENLPGKKVASTLFKVSARV
jgi:hypothetical protein